MARCPPPPPPPVPPSLSCHFEPPPPRPLLFPVYCALRKSTWSSCFGIYWCLLANMSGQREPKTKENRYLWNSLRSLPLSMKINVRFFLWSSCEFHNVSRNLGKLSDLHTSVKEVWNLLVGLEVIGRQRGFNRQTKIWVQGHYFIS